jgi:multiple sugar transport system ATP-binding protein
MDEPLSNLDAKLRVQIRSEIASLQARLGTTTLYVTHDQVEAMTLGQRVAVMRDGRLQQVADPQTLYRRPANLFVAGFIGNPGMNLFRAPLVKRQGGLAIVVGGTHMPLPPEVIERHPGISKRDGQELVVGIRPEAIELGTNASHYLLPANVRMIESLGHETLVHADCALATLSADVDSPQEKKTGTAPPLTVVLPGHHPLKPGDTLYLRLNSEAFCLFDLNGRVID